MTQKGNPFAALGYTDNNFDSGINFAVLSEGVHDIFIRNIAVERKIEPERTSFKVKFDWWVAKMNPQVDEPLNMTMFSDFKFDLATGRPLNKDSSFLEVRSP